MSAAGAELPSDESAAVRIQRSEPATVRIWVSASRRGGFRKFAQSEGELHECSRCCFAGHGKQRLLDGGRLPECLCSKNCTFANLGAGIAKHDQDVLGGESSQSFESSDGVEPGEWRCGFSGSEQCFQEWHCGLILTFEEQPGSGVPMPCVGMFEEEW
jgi:hypothetical protein